MSLVLFRPRRRSARPTLFALADMAAGMVALAIAAGLASSFLHL